MIERFAHKHIIIFSIIISVTAALFCSDNWDNIPYIGRDAITLHTLTSLAVIWMLRKFSMLHMVGFGKEGFKQGVLWGVPYCILMLFVAVYDFDFTNIATPNTHVVLMFTASIFISAFAEEILFRGLILNLMMKKWGVIKAVIVSSLIFGMLHTSFSITPHTIIHAINATAGGIFFSAIYLRYKNIWSATVVHFFINSSLLFLDFCFSKIPVTFAMLAQESSKLSIFKGSSEMSIFKGSFYLFIASGMLLFCSIILLKQNQKGADPLRG